MPAFITIIVPMYNETQRLERLFSCVSENIVHDGYRWIFINDGSTDTTLPEICKLMQKHPEHIRLVSFEHNQGKGMAIQAGVQAAETEWLAYLDADMATDIASVAQCIARAQAVHADIVCGSRYCNGAVLHVPQPPLRYAAGWLFRLVAHLIFPSLPVYDTQNGCKVLRTAVAKDIFSRLQSARWAFDLEILLRAADHYLRVEEVGVVWSHQIGSHVNVRQSCVLLTETLRLWFFRTILRRR
jgi:glycosyltransferase involved in cell wall biosynthesis